MATAALDSPFAKSSPMAFDRSLGLSAMVVPWEMYTSSRYVCSFMVVKRAWSLLSFSTRLSILVRDFTEFTLATSGRVWAVAAQTLSRTSRTMNLPLASRYNWLALRIKYKILGSVLAVFILIYSATLSYIYSHLKQDLLHSARQEALSTTQMLAATLYRNYEVDSDSREIQSFILGAVTYNTKLLEISVIDRNLEVVSSTEDEKLFAAAVGQRYTEALENTSSIQLLAEEPTPYINIVYPISAGPDTGNYVTGAVELRSSLQTQFQYLASIRTNTLGAGVAILIGISLVITLLSQSITRPIRNLYTGMGRVNKGDLNIQVPVVSRDEIGYLTTTFNDMVGSLRVSNERIRAMMESSRRFVPDQFLTALGKNDITDVRLGDAILRDMTVLFMDIRNFTDMSEHMSADENLLFLNSLLENVLPAIEEYRGFIDKYMGDAVMALFPDKPDHALLAAIALRQGMAVYNREREERGYPKVEVGVGINSGELILGTLGSASRIDTTVIGSTVNIAARLEKLTKEYKVPIILPEEVFLAMDPSTRNLGHTRSLGPVKIRGIEKEMQLIGVLA